jgi:ABC-type transport system involved in cytochrome bd biosynthesis fused ATPase/permease subunit
VRYLELARAMDRSAAWLMALVSRGWLLLGLLGLASAFLAGRGSPAALAVGLGGVLLAHEAFKKLATGLARALLQRADVVVLVESFAALDPETLHRALRCVLARAATLLVIAHP